MVPTRAAAGTIPGILAERGIAPDRMSDGDADPGIANTEVDGVPQLVVRCADAADVATVVGVARDHGLPLAVRGGGYSPAGLGIVDAGIVIDLGDLDAIVVDADRAVVRVGGGVLAGALESALSAHGLAATLPVPSRAGVVGAALQGGVGVLVRTLGYISDAIVGATVVTGTGDTVIVDESDETGLLWALKGGGGNFGVVTELVLRCARIPRLTAVQLVFGADRLAEGLDFYCAWSDGLPADVTTVAMARRVPPFPGVVAEHVGTVGLIVTVIHAEPDRAGEDLAGLSAAPDTIYRGTVTCSPAELREAMERGFPHARFGAVIRSGWADALDRHELGRLADLALTLPSPHSIVEVVRLGGAIPRVAAPGCAPGRHAEFLLNVMALWSDPGDADASRAWIRDGTDVIHGVADGPALIPGFVSQDELDRAPATYGPDYPRLQLLKSRFDPHNLFRRTLTIQGVPQ